MLQFRNATRLAMHDFQRLMNARGDDGRHSDAVDEGPYHAAQIIDQFASARDVAAATSQRLRKRSHPDVDLARINVEMLPKAVAALPQDTERVRFVDHQPSMMPLFDLDQAPQVRKVTVHAVEAFDHDQHALELAAHRGQQLVEVVEIVVREAAAHGARQHAAQYCTVVDDFVGNDQILGTDKLTNYAHVGRVATDEDQRLFAIIVIRKRAFQLAVNWTLTGDMPTGRTRYTVAIDCGFGRRNNFRMAVQSKIIIA